MKHLHHNSIVLTALALFALFCTACSSSKPASNEPVYGFVGKEYYLNDAEKALSADQLTESIQKEATVAAELRAKESKKAVARGVAQVGLGLATGNYRINPVADTPAARAKIKMSAYNNRIKELGGSGVDVEATMSEAIASRRTGR